MKSFSFNNSTVFFAEFGKPPYEIIDKSGQYR
jgi:hypothetical protein